MRAAAGLGVLALLGAAAATLDLVRVEGSSMEPTLCDGAALLLVRTSASRSPAPDALVVLADPVHPGERLVKRVAGTAGQTLVFADGVLVRDGRPVAGPWVDRTRTPGLYTAPVVVPAGTVYVLGDNLESSIDSRQLGAVPLTALSERVVGPLGGWCGRPRRVPAVVP